MDLEFGMRILSRFSCLKILFLFRIGTTFVTGLSQRVRLVQIGVSLFEKHENRIETSTFLLSLLFKRNQSRIIN